MPTAELTAFLESTLDDQIRAERALHNGDLTPRLSTWSHHDHVTVFGAGVPFCRGWTDVHAVFDWLATTFTACEDYDFDSSPPMPMAISRIRSASSATGRQPPRARPCRTPSG